MKPINTIQENTGDFTSLLTDNSLVHKKFVTDRQSYVHHQNVPASIWTINHPLGYPPSGIVVIDSSGAQCYGSVDTLTTTQVIIDFGSAFSGICYLS